MKLAHLPSHTADDMSRKKIERQGKESLDTFFNHGKAGQRMTGFSMV